MRITYLYFVKIKKRVMRTHFENQSYVFDKLLSITQ